MRFYDDNPVECDCGCTVYAGYDFRKCSITLVEKKKPIKIEFTCCNDIDCFERTLTEQISDYVTEDLIRVRSAEDKEAELSDIYYEDSI